MALTPEQLERGRQQLRSRFAEYRQLIDLGLLVGYPNRLTPGENRVTRALKEIRAMREDDAALQRLRDQGDPAALAMPSGSEKMEELFGHSLNVFEKILTADVPFEVEFAKLTRQQLDAGGKIINLIYKARLELIRGQNINAVASLLQRMRAKDAEAVTVDNQEIEADKWGLEEES